MALVKVWVDEPLTDDFSQIVTRTYAIASCSPKTNFASDSQTDIRFDGLSKCFRVIKKRLDGSTQSDKLYCATLHHVNASCDKRNYNFVVYLKALLNLGVVSREVHDFNVELHKSAMQFHNRQAERHNLFAWLKSSGFDQTITEAQRQFMDTYFNCCSSDNK